jgi:hypothetical protein
MPSPTGWCERTLWNSWTSLSKRLCSRPSYDDLAILDAERLLVNLLS